MSTIKSYLYFAKALAEVTKSVKIEIAQEDFEILKSAKYKLCFAKKVGDNAYNVVWQSYIGYLMNNTFSWTPEYQLFGSNIFQSDVRVDVSSNMQDINLGQTCILNQHGYLESPASGGPETSLTLQNEYGPIHPGVNQLSTGINGERISTPIYVSQDQAVKGSVVLTPVEKVLVWFEQNIETSTMFSDAKAKSVEIDLTRTNQATRLYAAGEWKTPKENSAAKRKLFANN